MPNKKKPSPKTKKLHTTLILQNKITTKSPKYPNNKFTIRMISISW